MEMNSLQKGMETNALQSTLQFLGCQILSEQASVENMSRAFQGQMPRSELACPSNSTRALGSLWLSGGNIRHNICKRVVLDRYHHQFSPQASLSSTNRVDVEQSGVASSLRLQSILRKNNGTES